MNTILLSIALLLPQLTFSMEQERAVANNNQTPSAYTILKETDKEIESASTVEELGFHPIQNDDAQNQLKKFLEETNELQEYKLLKIEKKDTDIFALAVDPKGIQALFKFDGQTGFYTEIIDTDVVQFTVHPTKPILVIAKRETIKGNNLAFACDVLSALVQHKNQKIKCRIMICPFSFLIDTSTTKLSFDSDKNKNYLYYYNNFNPSSSSPEKEKEKGAFRINLQNFFEAYDALEKNNQTHIIRPQIEKHAHSYKIAREKKDFRADAN